MEKKIRNSQTLGLNLRSYVYKRFDSLVSDSAQSESKIAQVEQLEETVCQKPANLDSNSSCGRKTTPHNLNHRGVKNKLSKETEASLDMEIKT